MRIVAYKTSTQDGQVFLQESTGENILSSNLDALFSFLLEPYENCLKVCWSLDTTVSSLLRLLGRTACKALRTQKRWHEPPFDVFYIPDKIFSVSHVSGQRCNLYGLEQYWPDLEEPSLEEVQALGMGLLKELHKMGLHPTKLTSPVAIYEESILSKLDLPKLKDIPPEAAEMAARCSGKLWVEAHALGFYP